MNTSSDAIRFGSSSSKRSFVTTALFPNLTRAMNETGFRKIVFAKRSPNTSTSSSGEQTTMAVVSRTMRTSLNNHSSSSSNSSVYRISVRAYAKSLSQMKESGLKAYKPTTPGFRGRVITDRSKLWKGNPLKQLTKGLMKSGGRNNHGRITVWHKGGGHKRLYREIDFKRDLYNVAGVVRRIEYDPNRTTRIALIDYPEGNKPRYILAPDGTKAGDVVMSGNAESTNTIDLRPGNAMSLSEMPIGTIIHNVELVPGKGGAMARSAGASATLVKKGSDGYCAIKLPSGELRLVPSKCVATVGVLSNREHQNINLGKAGAKRWKGVRPTVRGTAMNPIDHPHGGGEGRSKGDNKSVSPWGVETKGKRTRNNKRTDSMRLQRRPMNRKRYPLLVK
jgi:large subunit ribosomal protein L2